MMFPKFACDPRGEALSKTMLRKARIQNGRGLGNPYWKEGAKLFRVHIGYSLCVLFVCVLLGVFFLCSFDVVLAYQVRVWKKSLDIW